ncbi:MAG: putative pyridoxal phosphate-dependent enzyme apparently involved in regulation of cell wall [Candidatus Levybacteria bacterium]|nr:putative pyridoxal phosphate-dependent enzyme apparently involved in regulation of cell wall [Candidatus Levybacteria bacterium]
MKQIDFIDLVAQYKLLEKEIDAAVKRVLLSGKYILGTETGKFEEEFAKYCQADYAVGVDSGISALELGMRALGIKELDQVLVPANSFIASASAVSFVGATPVFVDCLEDTFNIDVKDAEKKISKKTKAIMPVHLYGQIADMEAVSKLAKKHKLFIVEDACQAHGASNKGKNAGSFGDIAAFSFYPAKNLGAYGDGGMLVTKHFKIAKIVKQMRNYGQKEKYHHKYLAWNKRLDSLQAAILRVKLMHLSAWNKKRLEKAKLYNMLLQGLPIVTPKIFEDYTHIFSLYVIRVKNREKLEKFLKNKGIATGIHFPTPINDQEAYAFLHQKNTCPVTEKLSREILSLPLYPELSKEAIVYISQSIKQFYS